MSAERLRVGVGVEVRVPASSANLGPGSTPSAAPSGVLGHLPGHRHARARASWSRSRVRARVPCRSTPPTWCTARCRSPGPSSASSRPRACTLDCRNEVPHGRGMGSSATAIVTGIVAAQALHDLSRGLAGDDVDLAFAQQPRVPARGPPRQRVGERARRRHPVVDGRRRGADHDRAPAPCTPTSSPVVFVPEAQLSTAKARSVLPAAGAPRGRRRQLGARRPARARPRRRPEHLLAATRDWLHQEARRTSYAESMALVDALRADGPRGRHLGRGPVGARPRHCATGSVRSAPRRRRLAGADSPASRRAARVSRCSPRAEPPRASPPGACDAASAPAVLLWALRPQSMPGIPPVACRESPSTIWAAVQPCAAVPDVGSQ